MNIELRRARIEDIPALDRVMQVISGAPGDYGKMEKLMRHIDADPQKYLLVAVDTDADKVVGSLFGVAFEDICGDGSPILLVENVAVLESCQGRGIGRMMFREIERWGREQGCHYEILVSGMERTGAHKFYSALGFNDVRGFKKYL